MSNHFGKLKGWLLWYCKKISDNVVDQWEISKIAKSEITFYPCLRSKFFFHRNHYFCSIILSIKKNLGNGAGKAPLKYLLFYWSIFGKKWRMLPPPLKLKNNVGLLSSFFVRAPEAPKKSYFWNEAWEERRPLLFLSFKGSLLSSLFSKNASFQR